MTDPNRPETFEAYPYETPGAVDDFGRPARPEPAPPAPVALPGPPTTGPVTRGPRVTGRRAVLGGIVTALAAAGVAGVVGLRGFSSAPEPSPVGEAYPVDPPPDDSSSEGGYATFEGEYGSLGVDVPQGWRVEREGRFVLLIHEHGRLLARTPERVTASADDLAREADYLRDGFEPEGDPTVMDRSTTGNTVMIRTGAGHLAGQPATEELLLDIDRDLEPTLALAVWWAATNADREATVQARTMADQLRRQFEEF